MNEPDILPVVNGSEPRQIALVCQARHQLAESRSIDEVKDIRDKAEALRLYLRQRDEGLEAQNEAAEVKLWAERRAGELIAAMPKRDGGHAAKARSNHATELPPTLAEQGISKDESSRWQTIASVPEPEFVEHIEETKAAGKELTTNGVLAVAKGRDEVKRDSGDDHEEAARRWTDSLRKLCDDVNLLCVSIPRRGGFANLVRRWSPRSRKATIAHLKDLRDAADRGIRELKGLDR